MMVGSVMIGSVMFDSVMIDSVMVPIRSCVVIVCERDVLRDNGRCKLLSMELHRVVLDGVVVNVMIIGEAVIVVVLLLELMGIVIHRVGQLMLIQVSVLLLIVECGMMIDMRGQVMIVKVDVLVVCIRIVVIVMHCFVMIIEFDMLDIGGSGSSSCSIVVSVNIVNDDRGDMIMSMNQLWMEVARVIWMQRVVVLAVKRKCFVSKSVVVDAVMHCLGLDQMRELVVNGANVVLHVASMVVVGVMGRRFWLVLGAGSDVMPEAFMCVLEVGTSVLNCCPLGLMVDMSLCVMHRLCVIHGLCVMHGLRVIHWLCVIHGLHVVHRLCVMHRLVINMMLLMVHHRFF